MSAPPAKYATPRDPSCRTFGPRVAAVSAGLGAPFMPWQHQVANVASEVVPDPVAGWRWKYRTVIITVPRQSGKTTLLQAVHVDRAITRPNTGVWMTAQTGKDARKRWRDELQLLIGNGSPLRSVVRPYLSGGSERADFPNGSFIAPFAPVPKSLHGETPPFVSVDEAWAFDDLRGDALMAAIRPAQIAVPQRQLWIVSTKGTKDSTFLNGQLAAGRRSLLEPRTDIAYFEWSADETLAAADPRSAETLAFHPALGHTQRLEDLQAEYDADPNPANFRRGFLNLETVSDKTVLDLAAWDELSHADDPPPAPPLAESVIAYCAGEARAGAAIWQAWRDPDTGQVRLRYIADGPGVSWLPDALHKLRTAGAHRFVTEDAGATRTVTVTAELAGLDVTTLQARDYATACGLFLGRAREGTLTHDGEQLLRDHLEAAEARPMGGGVGLSEQHSRGPIYAAKAALMAAYATEQDHGMQLF